MCGKKSADGQQIREKVKTGAEKLSMVLLSKIMIAGLNPTSHTMVSVSAAGKIDVPERIGEIDNPLLPLLTC
jgi:hypothetical protein